MIASRLIFLTLMCGILFAQESTDDSSMMITQLLSKKYLSPLKRNQIKKKENLEEKWLQEIPMNHLLHKH